MSPTATLVTAEPTSCTQPAFSCPIVYGSGVLIAASHWPSMMCRSVRQTPAPPILTMTSSGPADLRLGHLVDHRLGVEFVQPNGLHWSSSTCFAVLSVQRSGSGVSSGPLPFLLVHGCRGTGAPACRGRYPELASMLTRVSRALRRCSGTDVRRHALAGRRVDQQRGVVAGRQAELGPPLPQPVQSARRRQLAERHREQCRRMPFPLPAAAGTPGRCRPSPPCAGSRPAARPAR